MAEKVTKRFACLTDDLQLAFDRLNARQQQYCLLRGQGLQKTESYRRAGYRNTKNAGVSAYCMEKENPVIADLIRAFQGHQARANVYKEGTAESKEVDKRAKGKTPEQLVLENKTDADLVPRESGVMEEIPNLDLSQENARRAQLYRRISNGTMKNTKIIKQYDADGNLKGTKVEETVDLDTCMRARKELDRVLGVNDMLTIGEVKAGSINIMIVDASKKAEDATPPIDLPNENVEIVEEYDNGREKGTTEEDTDNADS